MEQLAVRAFAARALHKVHAFEGAQRFGFVLIALLRDLVVVFVQVHHGPRHLLLQRGRRADECLLVQLRHHGPERHFGKVREQGLFVRTGFVLRWHDRLAGLGGGGRGAHWTQLSSL